MTILSSNLARAISLSAAKVLSIAVRGGDGRALNEVIAARQLWRGRAGSRG
jgi:hypothetical protein